MVYDCTIGLLWLIMRKEFDIDGTTLDIIISSSILWIPFVITKKLEFMVDLIRGYSNFEDSYKRITVKIQDNKHIKDNQILVEIPTEGKYIEFFVFTKYENYVPIRYIQIGNDTFNFKQNTLFRVELI